jgi:UDP-2,3-diacylglucosamine hydrolase
MSCWRRPRSSKAEQRPERVAGSTRAVSSPPPLPVQGRGAARDPEVLFVSDLHLGADTPALTALFLSFLDSRAAGAEALYILGDLFDAWIGDDDTSHGDIEAALADLTRAGTRCLLMRGNRDFLLGRRFARRTGCTLLRDPTRILLAGEPVLLMHGDLLCTDDVAYQRFRRKVRNPLLQWLFLRRPLASRRQAAADYRRKSAAAMADKPAEIMDVNAGAVLDRLRRHRVRRLIHGHTHRPADHRLSIDGHEAHRHVLSDWHPGGGEVLVAAGGTVTREPVWP